MMLRLQVRQPGDPDWFTLNEASAAGNPDDQERVRASLVKHQQRWQQTYAPFISAAFRIERTK